MGSTNSENIYSYIPLFLNILYYGIFYHYGILKDFVINFVSSLNIMVPSHFNMK